MVFTQTHVDLRFYSSSSLLKTKAKRKQSIGDVYFYKNTFHRISFSSGQGLWYSLESANFVNEDDEFFGPRTTTFSFSNMAAFRTQSYEILRNVPSPSTCINTNFAKLATNLVQNVEEKSSKQIMRQNRNFSKKRFSPAGNRTPVSRVTGGDTHHYTTEELG